MTSVCPCSKAISDYGAHNQRSHITIEACTRSDASTAAPLWVEELIDIAEAAASSPVFPLLKRPDERHVTMHAHDNPVFVEDMAREVARALSADPHIAWFSVEAASDESIHNHQAFARIRSQSLAGCCNPRGRRMTALAHDDTATIHVVVTCTNRKIRPVPSRLRLAQVRGASASQRAREWVARLGKEQTDSGVPARDLYAGEHWTVARGLPDYGDTHEKVYLWACSAGYGLIPASAPDSPLRGHVRSWPRRLGARRSCGMVARPE